MPWKTRKVWACQTWVSGARGRDLGHSPSSAPDFLCDWQVPPSLGPSSVICKTHTVSHDAQGALQSLLGPPSPAYLDLTACLPHQWLRGRSFPQKFTSPGGWVPSAWGLASGVPEQWGTMLGRSWRTGSSLTESAGWGQPEGRGAVFTGTCECLTREACLALPPTTTCPCVHLTDGLTCGRRWNRNRSQVGGSTPREHGGPLSLPPPHPAPLPVGFSPGYALPIKPVILYVKHFPEFYEPPLKINQHGGGGGLL